MPLDKRNISISFGVGIDTKTDPNQVMPGKLLSLNNAFLSLSQAITKRFGYNNLLPNLSIPSSSLELTMRLGALNNELITMDSKNLFTYNPTLNTNILIDSLINVEPSVDQIDRMPLGDVSPDSAFNATNNTYLYTWTSSAITPGTNYVNLSQGNTSFTIQSSIGSKIFSGSLIGISRAKAFSVGQTFIITGANLASSTLNYYYFNSAASSANLSMTSGIVGNLGGQQFMGTSAGYAGFRGPIYQRYDGTVLNNTLFLSFFSRSSSSIVTAQINQNGVVASSALAAGDASGALGVFGDGGNLWTIFQDGVSTSASFYTVPTTGVFSASTAQVFNFPVNNYISSSSQIGFPIQFTGTSRTAPGVRAANLYYQVYSSPLTAFVPSSAGSVSFQVSPRSDYLVSQGLNGLLGATSGSSAILIRGMGFASKAFQYQGDDFVLAAYGVNSNGTLLPNAPSDRLEPTYFLLNPTKQSTIVMKLAYQNGGGYDFPFFVGSSTNNQGPDLALPLPNVNNLGSSSLFQTTYLFKNAETTIGISPFIPIIYGVNTVRMDFNSINAYANVSLANTLNIAGGFLQNYDGQSVVENNFHLFPEDIRIGVGSSGSGGPNGIQSGQYSYKVLYEWIDATGNIHRSSPSIGYTVGSNNQVVYLNIPTLKATNKRNAVIRVYRNAPSIDVSTYHDVSPYSPIPNSTALDVVLYTDNAIDTSIIGNPDIYTTGGILGDTGTPCPTAISQYKDRLIMTDAENRTTLWFSKEVIAGTPVEMSSLQTIFLNSRYGDITAHVEMDDKLIIFKANSQEGSISYITGIGPDATGSNNDFSVPTLITTTVYTTNQRSVVLTPEGVMFKSNKGIWLLGRDLSIKYIGDMVESYNSNNVTSAKLIPNSTRVVFTLDSGVALVWDYYQRQWSVFTNIDATDSIIFQNLFTYLSQNGARGFILQETPNNYSDNGNPILMSLTTSWLSIAGLQGYERAYRMYLMGKYNSPHLLNVSISYDFNPNYSQTSQIRPAASVNKVYGNEPLYGASNTYGGVSVFEQNRINLVRQKCQSIQVTIQETIDPLNPVLGQGVTLENLGILIGTKLTYPKLSAKLTVT